MIDTLLAACRAAPDDDAPRLVWADAVGGERGELVVIQCDLARGGLSLVDAAVRRDRERVLLARYGAEWSCLKGVAKWCTFRRGFVDTAGIDLGMCVDRSEEIAVTAPLLDAVTALCNKRIEDRTDDTSEGPNTMVLVGQLLAAPALRSLHGLAFAHARLDIYPDRESAYEGGYGDKIIELALATGRMHELRAFGLGNCKLTDTGLGMLAAAGARLRLERLVLDETYVEWSWQDKEPVPLDRIPRGSLPSLRALEVRYIASPAQIDRIPPNVVELVAHEMSEEALDALVCSPHAANLERLALDDHPTDASVFEAFPRLRGLYVFGPSDVATHTRRDGQLDRLDHRGDESWFANRVRLAD